LSYALSSPPSTTTAVPSSSTSAILALFGGLVERYGEVPREPELACGGRRVRLRLASVSSRSARYYVRGAGQLAVMEADECVPAR
jgi:hypothetical protein